ncbi:MAG: methyltransferase domain-containing protein [Caldilineaceae bacterium]|nr:methyltransferase domain-containing protein [Caldilineaceae bacterium]
MSRTANPTSSHNTQHASLPTAPTCVVCTSTATEQFVTVPQVPVLCNILWPSKAEATGVRRVDIGLAFCRRCGHIWNPGFDPGLMDYSQVYENSLHFSPRFQQFAEELAATLVARHDLHGKDIVEISCGKGDFLELLCRLGHNNGYGFDPSYVGALTRDLGQGHVTFVQDFYSKKYQDTPADFLCCRHTLEHIEEPRDFLQMIRNTIGARQIPVYFEVPNVLFTLHDLAIWDIIYEHCGYFSADSLRYLFAQAGFAVTAVQPTYEGQFLYIEARSPAALSTLSIDETATSRLIAEVHDFADRYHRKVAVETEKLAAAKAAGEKVVIWGTGSKGITYLNMLPTQDLIEYAVDLNVRKQGKFVTGTGQQIVSPEFLQRYQPDRIIVMNPIYMDEIQQMVTALDLSAELVEA